MLKILEKDMPPLILLLFVFLPLSIVYWLVTREALDLTAIFIQTGYLFGIVMLLILAEEKQQMKNGGYAFLVTLPVKTSEIVFARFILILLLTAVFASVSVFFMAQLASTGEESKAASAVLLGGALAGLVFGGTVQTMSYRFGARKMILPIVLLTVLGYMGPIFADEFLVDRGVVSIGSLIELTRGVNIWVMTAAGLACYALIALGAVRVFRDHGANNG
jgi:hypothetical protein